MLLSCLAGTETGVGDMDGEEHSEEDELLEELLGDELDTDDGIDELESMFDGDLNDNIDEVNAWLPLVFVLLVFKSELLLLLLLSFALL